MSTQQDIYAVGSESRHPMLNKENYVPWSSRLLRYAKSRPNGKLIHNSILNGPYVRRMIPEPGDVELKGGGGSDKDSALPKGKCPRIASSLLEKMNEIVKIVQAMDSLWTDVLTILRSKFLGKEMEHVPLGGFCFTWAIKDATKMSKLDRFLVSEGLLCNDHAISGLIPVRHLSDHRPIILRECDVDYGPIPFKMFHLWFDIEGFEQLVKDSWHNDMVVDLNEMSYLKKNKRRLRAGVQEDSLNYKRDLWKELRDLDALWEKNLIQKVKWRS
nr:RNA-directed DNA polymerase, eukaryota [Tanacetum cinerariifolium]